MKIKVFFLYSTNDVKSQNRLKKLNNLKRKMLVNVKVGMIKFTSQFKALFKICYSGLSKT